MDDAGRRVLVVKGAPEQVMRPMRRRAGRRAAHAVGGCSPTGSRVVAVASRPAPDLTASLPQTSPGSALNGFLVFADNPKAAARESLAQLAALGIEVKVATGDNPAGRRKGLCASWV